MTTLPTKCCLWPTGRYSSLVQFYLSDAGYSSVMDIQDPRGESDDALEAIVTHLRAGEGSSFMESEFDFPAIADPAAPVVADVVRSYFYFGLPLAGYEGYESDADAANQKETQQDIILEKAVQPIGELLYPRWNDAAAAETCDRVFFSLSGVNSYVYDQIGRVFGFMLIAVASVLSTSIGVTG